METLIDLWIVLFIPLMVYRGYRRGGILTFCSFCTVFVAFFVATLLSNNFCDPVGRLVQPAIKQSIMSILEERLKYEDIVIEKPSDIEVSDDVLQVPESVNPFEKEPVYLTMSRALDLLDGAVKLEKLEGFLNYAKETLATSQEEYVGSVADVISTLMGREIARVLIFAISFILSMAIWLLFSRILAVIFKFPGLAEANAIAGAGIGLFLGIILIYVFAWATGGGIIPMEGVERTVLYEFFVKNSPMDLLASASSINLDL